MTLLGWVLPITLLVSACSDDGGSTADAAPPDPCAPMMTFVGELVDWDSGATGFLGIFNATMTLRSDPSFTGFTNPNGRYPAALMCIPAMDGLVDVAPPAGSDYVAGTIVVNKAVQSSQPPLSFRSFTMTRAQDFGFSSSLAHVYVHIHGAARTVTTAAAPGEMWALVGTAWGTGNTGNDIYLGNIPVSANTTLMVSGGDVTGPTMIPLSTGQFTYVELVAR